MRYLSIKLDDSKQAFDKILDSKLPKNVSLSVKRDGKYDLTLIMNLFKQKLNALLIGCERLVAAKPFEKVIPLVKTSIEAQKPIFLNFEQLNEQVEEDIALCEKRLASSQIFIQENEVSTPLLISPSRGQMY